MNRWDDGIDAFELEMCLREYVKGDKVIANDEIWMDFCHDTLFYDCYLLNDTTKNSLFLTDICDLSYADLVNAGWITLIHCFAFINE